MSLPLQLFFRHDRPLALHIRGGPVRVPRLERN